MCGQRKMRSSLATVALVTVVVAIVAGAVALQRASDLGWVPARLRPLVTALNACAATWMAKVGVLGWTLTCWMATAIGWQLCLRSVGVELGFMQAISLVCGVTLVTVLSLIPGGLGASELGTVAMLVQFDVPIAEAQAAAVILRVYGVMFILLSLLHVPFAPTWRREAQGQLSP